MKPKHFIGIVFLILAAAFLVNGIISINSNEGISISHESGLGVSRAVGTFTPFIVTLIVGLILLQKPKSE